MFEKLTPAQKKVLNWLAFCVLIGVGFMLVQPPSNPVREEPPIHQPVPVNSATDTFSPTTYEERMERELTVTLSQIDGVGNVKVFVTLERGPKIQVAETLTEENRITEENGQVLRDTRKTTSPVTLQIDGEQKEIPLVLQEFEPIVRGVIVVAEGASNPEVQYRVARAVQTVLQIAMYRIDVLPKVQ